MNTPLWSRFSSSASGEDVYVTHSLEEALKLLSTPPLSDRVETVWNLGGASIYKVGNAVICGERLAYW